MRSHQLIDDPRQRLSALCAAVLEEPRCFGLVATHTSDDDAPMRRTSV